jgi:Phage protein
VLVSPNGYRYEAWQLEYIQWVFASARLWLAERQRLQPVARHGLPSSSTKFINVAVLYNRRSAAQLNTSTKTADKPSPIFERAVASHAPASMPSDRLGSPSNAHRPS